MKFQLTTWDRISLVRVIEQQSGDMKFVRQAGRVLDALELTAEEQHAVGMSGDGQGTVTWKDTAHVWEIELQDRDTQFVRDLAQRHAWPGVAVRLVSALAERLGIALGD
jgi:hypothetical protein